VARNRRGSRSKSQGSAPDQISIPGQGSRSEPRHDGGSKGNRLKVVSGGQTGIDRGALDAALELDLECGGWCPEGRLAEDGAIPEQYPLQELEGGDYRDRTRKNVLDSDGTAIIYFGELEGGTESTLDDCVQLDRPYKLVNGSEFQPGQAAKMIADFVRETGVYTLNVAGPRASKVERGHRYAFDTVRLLVDLLKRNSQPPAARRSTGAGGRPKPSGQSQGHGGNGNGSGNSNVRGGKGRNPQFNAQKRKGSGQQHRSRRDGKPPGMNEPGSNERGLTDSGGNETGGNESATD
jgi:hypothetical protein